MMQQLTARSWRRLKSVVFPLAARAKNDYATHVPVLVGLAMVRRVESVLEFGCGHYSTNTFLNRSAFPHLQRLASVENDPVWGEQIRTAVKHDGRCAVALVTGPMSDAVSDFDLESFDLILIDDSTTSEQRAATIRAIANHKPRRPWIVIHDYEIEDYRRAAAGFSRRHAFKAFNPHTGLVFNTADSCRRELKNLDRSLKENNAKLEPDDVAGWIGAFLK